MERRPPEWRSFPSLAEIPRVHLSCHLHCNCPLFCHLDYIQQGHANEERLKNWLPKSQERAASKFVQGAPNNFHRKSHMARDGNQAWDWLIERINKYITGTRVRRKVAGTKAWYLPGSAAGCSVASSRSLSWWWCLHLATPRGPSVPGATLGTETRAAKSRASAVRQTCIMCWRRHSGKKKKAPKKTKPIFTESKWGSRLVKHQGKKLTASANEAECSASVVLSLSLSGSQWRTSSLNTAHGQFGDVYEPQVGTL